MKASEGKIGRVFVLRLEHGDIIPDVIEAFAGRKKIGVAQVIMVGGVCGGQVVVGPRYSDKLPPEPIVVPVDGAHELAGLGLIAPDHKGKPVLHVHAALGRSGKTTTGCMRLGVPAWIIGEVVVIEILGTGAVRLPDKKTGFELLSLDKKSSINKRIKKM